MGHYEDSQGSFFCFFHRYKLMLECWNEDPNQRPTFTQIRLRTVTILERLVSMLLFDLVEHRMSRQSPILDVLKVQMT